MKSTTKVLLLILAIYSVALIAVELMTSQDHVRHYFTDIEGPVRFYAVNTSLSVFLLWATALLFAVCLLCVNNQDGERRLWWFFVSQVAVFAYLGLDDRFKLHESFAWRLGIGDHYVLFVVALAECFFLLALGRREVLTGRSGRLLLAAAVLFGVMIFFDAVAPHDMVLRLTLEDLAKTWANVFFFAFAWHLCCQQIERLKGLGHTHFAETPA
ncbi:MAG: hypothetical protein DWQ42_17175 [Planctomycetota bacterium]|mgnify:CR=1 FL=1|nr:MAG: hypothetical protein DWQ42_17175 [Planctomycetota bacterium]REK39739.1 MAG: hypothetical protein DWQ46_17635 [Planctomycetota bacterium]